MIIRWSLEIWKKNYQNYRSFDLKGRERKSKSIEIASLAVSRITNKRTNKSQKWPRGSKELAERSLSFKFHANRSINKEMAGVLVKMLKVHGQKAGLAVQWLVEIKSSLHGKRPDSREVFGRALNAVFSWLVALEIGWFTKKLELENIYPFHIDLSSSPVGRCSSHFSFSP